MKTSIKFLSFYLVWLCLLFTLSISAYSQHLPGSGNSLSFNGTNNYIDVQNNASINPQSYTIECWVKILSNTGTHSGGNANGGDRYIIFKKRPNVQVDFEYIGLVYHTNHSFQSWTVSSSDKAAFCTTSQNFVSFNNWYHIAVSADSHSMKMYINGVLIDSSVTGFALDPGNTDLYIGRTNEPEYEGFCNMDIDEVRIWNSVLPQKQIRDWMCKTVLKSHPSYSHLVSYYRFDQNSGTTLNDAVGSNNGSIFNNPQWIKSASAIGNASSYTYNGTSLTLNSKTGESLKIDKVTGTPTGMQIYRVDEAPTAKNGIKGLGPNDKYFGVFIFGDSSFKYRLTYNYKGNPFVLNANQDSLKLYKRLNNSINSWTDASATLDTTKKTLIVTENNIGEYIVGSTGTPLQIPKTVIVHDTIISEGNKNTTKLSIPIYLSDTATLNSSFDYETEDSTAKYGQDYIKQTGSVAFVPGQLRDTIHITIKGDTSSNSDKVFKIKLKDSLNLSLPDTLILVTIKNDDTKKNVELLTDNKKSSILKSFFKLSPNPANDFIDIVSSENLGVLKITVSDLNDQMLYYANQEFMKGQGVKLSLTGFPYGVLFIKIANDNGFVLFKILKRD